MNERTVALKGFLRELYDEAHLSVSHVKVFNRLWFPLEDYGYSLKRKSSVQYNSLNGKDVADAAWMVAQLVWKEARPKADWGSIDEGQLKVVWWNQKESRI